METFQALISKSFAVFSTLRPRRIVLSSTYFRTIATTHSPSLITVPNKIYGKFFCSISSSSEMSQIFDNDNKNENNKLVEFKQMDLWGYKVRYCVVGQGPSVVFCHPGVLGSMSLHTRELLKAVNGRQLTFVTWDQPGYAGSAPPERDVHDGSLLEDAEMMTQFMQKLGYDKYSVMGWSGGGCSALLAAIKHPEVVQKLLLWGTFAYVDQQDAQNFKFFAKRENQKGRLMETLVKEFGADFYHTHFSAWMQNFYRIYSVHHGIFISHRLKEIQCPTLIFHGEQDSLVAPRHGQFLAENIPNARLILWPKGKHNVHLRYAHDFHRIMHQFFTDQEIGDK